MTTTAELFEQYNNNRSTEIRNAIVEKYLYMVDILIKKYLHKGVEYDDLYQVGAMALVLAVERFDSTKGYEFSSFATPTIIGEIKRYFRDKGWAMHVPRRLKELSLKIPAAKEELYNKYMRNPTIKEISEYLEVTEEQVLEAMEGSQAYSVYSINKTIDDDSDGTADESFEKFTGINDSQFDSFENADFIKKTMEKFSDIEKEVCRMRFFEGRTQLQTAQKMGVSQMTISRIEKKIKTKFREEYNK